MTEFQNRKVLLVSSSFLFVLGANLISYGASAQDLSIPNTFAAGTPAVAAEVNANFDAVATAVNDLGRNLMSAPALSKAPRSMSSINSPKE